MMTLNKLKQLVRLPHNVLSEVTNLPTVNDINEAIIGLVMTAIKLDMEALHFCEVLENVVDSKSSKHTLKY